MTAAGEKGLAERKNKGKEGRICGKKWADSERKGDIYRKERLWRGERMIVNAG